MKATTTGPKSEALHAELTKLQTTRDQVVEGEAKLTRAINKRQRDLDRVRAVGLLGEVDRDQLAAFEAELETLQRQLARKRSELAGLEALLDEKRRAFEEAKVADAQAAIMTKEMEAAQKGLERNAKALTKTQNAIIQALEAGAAALLEEIAPHRETWTKLVTEREVLYVRRRKALGANATMGDDAYRKMLKDPRVKLFSNGQEIPQAVELVELLRPLIDGAQAHRRR